RALPRWCQLLHRAANNCVLSHRGAKGSQGARGRAAKAPTRRGQAPEPCCRGESRWGVGTGAKAEQSQEMPPARLTPELRGAAKRHPLERIVRRLSSCSTAGAAAARNRLLSVFEL